MLGAHAMVAARHYESSIRCTGTARLGGERRTIDCYGMRDHSWGPRDLTSLEYSRWVWARIDDATVAVLWTNRAAGHTVATGVIIAAEGPSVAESVGLSSRYDDTDQQFTRGASISFKGLGRHISVDVEVRSTLPLYYEQNGRRARVIEYGCQIRSNGRIQPAWMEYIDNIVDGAPAGNAFA